MTPPIEPAEIGLVRRGYSASGGAEAYLLRLAAGLQQRGCRTTFYTTEDWPADRWKFGEIIHLPGGGPLEFARAFQRAKKPGQIVLSLDRVPGCDVFRAGDGVHAAWLARRGKFEPGWKRALRSFNPKHFALLTLEREVFRSVRTVIANSRMVAEEIRHWHDFPEERIHIVPNGIGAAIPTIGREEARQRLELPDDAFCVLFVGTGWDRKGLRFAIEAVQRMDNALLLVAGRGPASRFRSPSARFFGPMSDLTALFSAADVFTLPTIYDPFSNACLEALAAGLPVVTTSANGFSEILTPGVHGSVTEAGDVPALADALERWRGMDASAVCRELASHYSIERNVEGTLKAVVAAGAQP